MNHLSLLFVLLLVTAATSCQRGEARVTLADGREVVLSRSPQQDWPGESYEAEGMGLSRQDNIVVLRQQGREPLKCKELSATA